MAARLDPPLCNLGRNFYNTCCPALSNRLIQLGMCVIKIIETASSFSFRSGLLKHQDNIYFKLWEKTYWVENL